MRTPGTLVAMDPKGPRTSLGASGFGSQVSSWLGPPDSQMRITALRSAATAAAPCIRQRSRSGSDRPANPARPVCRNHRREPTRIKSEAGGCSSVRRACSAPWRAV